MLFSKFVSFFFLLFFSVRKTNFRKKDTLYTKIA